MKAAIDQRLWDLSQAVDLIEKRAAQLETYAAKNAAYGRDKGEESKKRRALVLRRVAAFLTDPRLHRLIREDERLLALLMEDPPASNPHMKPREITASMRRAYAEEVERASMSASVSMYED